MLQLFQRREHGQHVGEPGVRQHAAAVHLHHVKHAVAEEVLHKRTGGGKVGSRAGGALLGVLRPYNYRTAFEGKPAEAGQGTAAPPLCGCPYAVGSVTSATGPSLPVWF